MKKNYKIYFLLLLISMAISIQSFARDYYVAKNGVDIGNTNGTITSPFKTIGKANSLMTSGDVCYVREGVYREEIKVKEDNVTFRNYNNERVTVSGADLVTGWTSSSQGTGIYEAPFPGSELPFSMLFVNGKRKEMARWPNNVTGKMLEALDINSGYEKYKAFNGVGGSAQRKVQFDNLSGFPDDFFKGGYFKGLTGKIRLDPAGKIHSSEGNSLMVTPKTDLWIKNKIVLGSNDGSGFGFIFHLNALDIPGEWYQENNKVYYMPKPGINPNNLQIATKNRKWAFRILNKQNVTIKGIHIHAASLEIRNSSGCSFSDLSVQYLMPYLSIKGYAESYTAYGGIYVNGNNNTFKNCYIAHTWGNGFSIEAGNNNKIKNCYVEDIGWVGKFNASVQNEGFNTKLLNSTFGSSSRFHLRTRNKVQVKYCDLFECLKLGQDAGSLQGTNGGRIAQTVDLKGSEFAYNKIHDVTTLKAGGKQFAVAFYLEGCKNYTVHHNIVYNFVTGLIPDATFAYLGPRYTAIKKGYYYNNTGWGLDFVARVWSRDNASHTGSINDLRFWNNIFNKEATERENFDNVSLISNLDFQNNLRSKGGNGNSVFVDAVNGNFNLKAGSPAIDFGKNISGITTNINGTLPDAGAIEFGETFPFVGSTLNPNNYIYGSTTPTNFSIVFPKNDYAQIKNINLYPNPTKSHVYLTNEANWKLYTATGILIKEGKSKEIDLSSFPNGIYLISALENRFKVIKQ